ncbi:unnamed protein product [Musa acuminata subsp. malaccensis]|uniref:(wild Malaysian banana) hypothetical protein n=1 Tax=Musa acuminata subsp. malaccensis TaxID=214687 RepID=A0A804IB31_MUSAM|nr:unnamed protein product [Musa acuminata subsp. malaccensis]
MTYIHFNSPICYIVVCDVNTSQSRYFISFLPALIPSASLCSVARGTMSQDKGRPLPKFGEWDVNDPASAEGFTVIFKKARDEKKTGSNARETDSPVKEETAFRNEPNATKPSTKKWFCCMQQSAET